MQKKKYQQQKGNDQVLLGVQDQLDALLARLSQLEAHEFSVTYNHGQRTFVNSNTPTTVYTLALVANGLLTNGLLYIEIPFIYLNNTGAGKTVAFAFAFGSETFTLTTGSIGQGGNKRTGVVRIWLSNANSASAQNCVMEYFFSATAAEGSSASATAEAQRGYDKMTQDTSAAKTATLTITLSSNDPLTHNLETLSPKVEGPYRVV